MRSYGWLMAALLALLPLMGCGGFFFDGKVLPQGRTKSAEADLLETPRTPSLTPRPTSTPLATKEPPESLPSPTLAATAQPTLDPADLAEACDRLWALRAEGQALADEWNAWIATDPPSIYEHRIKVEELLESWQAHYDQVALLEVPAEARRVKTRYLSAVEAWRNSMRLEVVFLTQERPNAGAESVRELERARAEWNESYDLLYDLCEADVAP